MSAIKTTNLSISVKDSLKEVVDYLENNLGGALASETEKMPLKKQLQKLGAEAKSLLTSIENFERQFKKQVNNLNWWKELIENAKGSTMQMSLILAEQKKTLYLQTLLIKAYVFIEKVREYITKETIDYLFMIDGDKTQQTKIAHLSLKELLPMLSLAVDNKGSFKLQLSNIENIKNIEDSQLGIKNLIIQNFNVLMDQQFYKNKKGALRKIMPGFSFEVATIAAQKNRALSPTELINLYKKTIGQKAFYRGGDITKNGDIPIEILEKSQNVQLQLKKISVKDGSLGAQLATTKTLTRVLRVIQKICLSGLKGSDMTKLLNQYVFKAKKNISNKIEKELDTKINGALNSLLKI